jgi:hypothetical protein
MAGSVRSTSWNLGHTRRVSEELVARIQSASMPE